MKLKNYLLVISFAIATMTFAQPPRGQFNPEEMVKMQTEQMVKELGLNEVQTAKVSAINEKYGKKMGEAFQSAGNDRSKMRETMQAIRAEKDVELKEVLTTEQFTTYQEAEKKRMEERQQRMSEGRPNGNGAKRGQQRGTGN